MTENKLFCGDNLDVLRQCVSNDSVDLIYLDPPFNSNQDYKMIYQESPIVVFRDVWLWDDAAQKTYFELIDCKTKLVYKTIEGLYSFIGKTSTMAYLVAMTVRLIELYRALKPTGSIYFHCDSASSHYMKIVLDAIFGEENFQNEIVWKRTTSHNDPKRYGRIGDRIFYYSKSAQKTFNQMLGGYSEQQLKRYKYEDSNGRFRAENLTAPHHSETRTIEWRGTHPGANRQWRYSREKLEQLYSEGRILLKQNGLPRKDGHKIYLHEMDGAALQDIWTDIVLAPTASERLGYPTQKPLGLLERIIQSSSNSEDVVLDPFMGVGTTIVAAQKLGRKWIGIDQSSVALDLTKQRLLDEFNFAPNVNYYSS